MPEEKFKVGDKIEYQDGPMTCKGVIIDINQGFFPQATIKTYDRELIIFLNEIKHIKSTKQYLDDNTKEKEVKHTPITKEQFENYIIELVAPTANKDNTIIKADTETNDINIEVPLYPDPGGTKYWAFQPALRYDTASTVVEFKDGLIILTIPVKEGVIKRIL
jgi:hypothetical protein